jgi:cytochrome c551/c552
MKIKTLLFLGILAAFFSCGSSTSENSETRTELKEEVATTIEAVAVIDTISANYILLKNQCLICHGGAPTHDEIIAPPMQAVKWFYTQKFTTKGDFVNGIVTWGLNPNEETALMQGAIKRFNVMPKPATNEKDLKTIAAFIYDNQLEQPEWFEEHFKQMHGEGGNRMGKGKPQN